jgi:hypothetical protein
MDNWQNHAVVLFTNKLWLKENEEILPTGQSLNDLPTRCVLLKRNVI